MIRECHLKQYCNDYKKIKGYKKCQKDKSKTIYACHHILETNFSDGQFRTVALTREELKALDMYYNRPAKELIILTNSEHGKIHGKCSEVRYKYAKEVYYSKFLNSDKSLRDVSKELYNLIGQKINASYLSRWRKEYTDRYNEDIFNWVKNLY